MAWAHLVQLYIPLFTPCDVFRFQVLQTDRTAMFTGRLRSPMNGGIIFIEVKISM